MDRSSAKTQLRSLLLGALCVLPGTSLHAEALTESRDPVRGVSFYSVQLESAPLWQIQTAGSRFSPDDAITVGLSAMVSDDNAQVMEYILWLRHDGPRSWLLGALDQPLTIQLEDRRLLPLPLHVARQTGDSVPEPYIEKLEFALPPRLVKILLDEPSVVLKLETALGEVQKPLEPHMIETLRELTRKMAANSFPAQVASNQG